MRSIGVFLLALASACAITAQQTPPRTPVQSTPMETNSTPGSAPAAKDESVPKSETTAAGQSVVQPGGKLGADDLVALTVYDSPELTRNVRVDADGNIRLPMVRQRIHAEGLLPAELESAISGALVDEHILVNPIVTVAVVEYHSRPITVIGAVRNPTTFQASGSVTLLEAIVRAGGLTENAGSDILVSHPATMAGGRSALLTERVPVKAAMDISDPASTMRLEGGENVRVPDAGRVFVVGNVKRPGPIQITEGAATSVMKAVVLSGGLDSFSSKTAYIYRVESSGASNQIAVPVKKIMTMKSQDVPLYGNDTLYIPNATGQRISAKALSITLGVGLGVAGLLIYLLQ